MGDPAAEEAFFDAFTEVGKALSSGSSEIVDVLAQGERSAEGVAEEIGQSVATAVTAARSGAGWPRSGGAVTADRLGRDGIQPTREPAQGVLC